MIAVRDVAGDDRALADFAELPSRVYRAHGLRAPATPAETIALLAGRSPFTHGRRLHPLLAYENGKPVARAAALVDDRYNAHWRERLGHLILFEAASDAAAASRLLLDRSAEWLAAQGSLAIRAGFGSFEPGFVVDDYAHVLRRLWRHTLPHYHAFLKDSGFEVEKGSAEYVVRATDDTTARYREFLERARANGVDIVPLRQLPRERIVTEFCAAWNEAYAEHWGLAPMLEQELATLLEHHARTPTMDLSAIAYRRDVPIGVVLVQETPQRRLLARGASRRPPNRLETLSNFAVGVVPAARGLGLALSLAAHANLQLLARGARLFSYGLVADDNWPSRRTADKLGASAAANYLTYRRTLVR